MFCHTPHTANSNTAAPLWNRIVGNATYTLYSSSTMNGVISNPGAASLPCLSCHDGTQAVDAILNMPGSGQYDASARPWTYGVVANRSVSHLGLTTGFNNSGAAATNPSAGANCMTCHNPGSGTGLPGDATDFTAFLLGTDLSNDHPIGVAFPTVNGAGTDWKTPSGTKVSGAFTVTYFDEPGAGSGRLDKGDIRLFGAASSATVECASCHDPHGVPSGGAGSPFNPTFLRKTNDGSAVCLTCHNK